MGNDNPELKNIPDEGVHAEERKAGRNSDNQARKEEGEIESGNLGRLDSSHEDNTLTLHIIFRWGVKFLFMVMCSVVAFVVLIMCYLICTYVSLVRNDATQVASLLENVWHVLSGAAIVSFVQLIGWMVRTKGEDKKPSGRNR